MKRSDRESRTGMFAAIVVVTVFALGAAVSNAHAQRIRSVRPTEVSLAPGQQARVLVTGANLAGLVTARVQERGTIRRDILARVTPSRDGRTLTLTLSADRRAGPAERLQVVLSPRRPSRRSPPVTLPLRLSVKKPPPPKPRFSPVVVDTDRLTMTGTRFVPLVLDTPPLVMTGLRFIPVLLDTDRIAMTGLRFVPLVVDTETLRMTGLRFVPLVIDTEPLRMTGSRFVPLVIDTETLRMTGLREQEASQ